MRTQEEVEFIGDMTGKGKVRMDPAKICAIQD